MCFSYRVQGRHSLRLQISSCCYCCLLEWFHYSNRWNNWCQNIYYPFTIFTLLLTWGLLLHPYGWRNSVVSEETKGSKKSTLKFHPEWACEEEEMPEIPSYLPNLSQTWGVLPASRFNPWSHDRGKLSHVDFILPELKSLAFLFSLTK